MSDATLGTAADGFVVFCDASAAIVGAAVAVAGLDRIAAGAVTGGVVGAVVGAVVDADDIGA